MPAVDVGRLAGCLSCAAVSASGGLLAVCPNSSDVVLYERSPKGGWQASETLTGHEGLVSGLAFEGDDRLVSSSHDRNSFVWTRQRGSSPGWSPEMVVTKLTKAGLCVAWGPAGGKFAIGSGDASVCLCYYDASKELWAPRLIRKKHTSSVTALAWHPSGALLATVSTDGRCRLFNALVAEVDGSAAPAALRGTRFGDCLLELEIAGGTWGLAVAWSPDGQTLAFCSQRSCLELVPGVDVDAAGSLQRVAEQRQCVALPGLPLKSLAFLSPSRLVGGGFDFAPLLFGRRDDGHWHFLHKLQGTDKDDGGSQLRKRIKLFEGKARSSDAGPEDPHQNCILSVCSRGGDTAGPPRFCSAGLDGRVVEWELDPGS